MDRRSLYCECNNEALDAIAIFLAILEIEAIGLTEEDLA